MPNVLNVTTGKPKVGGAVFRAASGTTPPTDAVTALASAFKELGYASDDGLTNIFSGTVNKIHAWGGDVVLVNRTDMEDQFKVTLIEVSNEETLKAIRNAANVTGALGTGLTVKYNGVDPEEAVWVFELIYRNSVVKRIVIPRGVVSDVAEVNYTDDDAVGYQITIDAIADSNGNTHYEYLKSTAV
ncbi:MAG: phage tail protein [Clostridia bacterium]|nr:phage tail protein [Clostridia bacterium]